MRYGPVVKSMPLAEVPIKALRIVEQAEWAGILLMLILLLVLDGRARASVPLQKVP
jgi:hypothetical protein